MPRSVMRHQFSAVPKAQIPRSTFDRSHGFKTTFDAGYLVPIYVDEALPGDTFHLTMTSFARLSTPLHPIMDNIYADVFFFAVPIRLVWDNFQRFFGEQPNPGDSTSFLVPQVASPAGGWTVGSLGDYFGLPVQVNCTCNALHFRAYNLIYNEWFRDQNLQSSLGVIRSDGPDTAANYVMVRRGKRHDYFTSALPFPQKGPAVSVPLGTTAPVARINAASSPTFITATNLTNTVLNRITGTQNVGYDGSAASGESLIWGTVTGLQTDLSTATATTINQLRQAFQIQRIYERDARGGTRYTELILSHFGVTSPDARLQRPEFLGGGSCPVNVSPLAQTSATGVTGATTPLGNLAAIGTMSHSGVGFSKSFTEHCLLLGLMSVRADLNYQNCLNRMWSRQTRFDYYWPALSHIGEQTVLNKEIHFTGTPGTPTVVGSDDYVFGYQERYAEYRYKPSVITGQFRSQFAQTLDSWHLAQNFGTPVVGNTPTLNTTFIVENPPIARVVAVPAQPHFLLDAFFKLTCARPMPVYGVPGMIDHF